MKQLIRVVERDATRRDALRVSTPSPGDVFCPDAGGALAPLARKSDQCMSPTRHPK